MFRRVSLIVGWLLSCQSVVHLFAAELDRLELLSRLVQDEAPAVRVEALRALAKIPSARAAEVALTVVDRPMDPTLDYALWLTVNDLAEPWIEGLLSGAWKPEGREKQLDFALKALPPDKVARVLGALLADKPIARDGSGPWIEVIGNAGSAVELRRLFDQVVAGGFDAATTPRALKALGEAARLRNRKPGGDLSALRGFFRNPSGEIRLEAIRLAGLWKDPAAALPQLLEDVAGSSTAAPAERVAAFEALRQIGGDPVVQGLKGFASATDPAVQRSAAVALAALDATAGFPAVVAAAGTLSGEAEALGFWRSILEIKGASVPLGEALEGRKLPEVAARAGMRVAREGGRDDFALVTGFAAAGGLVADTQELTAELAKDLAARALARGDAHRGERVYRRADLACLTCHAIGGAGGLVGPDMTSIGASAPVDYLVESLLLPNAKIKEGYHSIVVETKDGEEVTGTLARESPEELHLRNVSGQEVAIPKASIQRREMGRLSLMPAGLIETLNEQDRLDLVAFLTQLGKPGDFDASRAGVARRWYIGNIIHTDIQNDQANWIWTQPLNDRRWVPLYSLAGGGLDAELLGGAAMAQAWTSKVAVVAATEIDQAAGGSVRFQLDPPDAELWVDGRKLGSGRAVTGEIPAGRHRVIVRFDPRQLGEGLRLEGEGAAFVLN